MVIYHCNDISIEHETFSLRFFVNPSFYTGVEEGTCKVCIYCPGCHFLQLPATLFMTGPPEKGLERDGLSYGEGVRNASLERPACAISFPGLTGKTEQV